MKLRVEIKKEEFLVTHSLHVIWKAQITDYSEIIAVGWGKTKEAAVNEAIEGATRRAAYFEEVLQALPDAIERLAAHLRS